MKNKTLAFSLLLLFFGCSEYGGLDSWMKIEKEKAQANYRRSYKEYNYMSNRFRDDYNLGKLSSVQPFSPLKMRLSYFPGADEVKGPLEYFDLSEMKYVGFLKNSLRTKAFIHIGDKVYTVFNGTPIGKNYGRVIRITPKKIIVRESVENFEGLWITIESEIERSSKENW